jgi:hypothetical protein
MATTPIGCAPPEQAWARRAADEGVRSCRERGAGDPHATFDDVQDGARPYAVGSRAVFAADDLAVGEPA